MSYLGPLRLHFAGKFQAAISTVNNDPIHYDNARFKPEYQQMSTGDSPDELNGWFNPRGSGDWRLLECAVTSAWLADGTAAPADDPVLAAAVADSDRAVPAKLADLDPEQQMVSTIWGLEIRVATQAGENLLRGRFAPVAFMDIWNRAQGPGGGGDVGAGAMYQSVLTDVEWGDVDGSPFLTALGAASHDGLLSVKFNVDGVNLDFSSPQFTLGRIVGTLGPAAPGEPRHVVAGRQFMAFPKAGSGGFFVPEHGINFCAGRVERATRRVYVDLGNALPTATPGGVPVDLGTVELRAGGLTLGGLAAPVYADAGWYRSTAGVVAFPPDRPLTDAELAQVEDTPLAIATVPGGAAPAASIAESPNGVFVRADQFVFRLNPGEQATAMLHATRLGKPYPHASVRLVRYNDQFQPVSPLGEAPAVGVPETGIGVPDRVETDEHGVATAVVTAADPGTPRGYIDGQLYGLYPVLEETVGPQAGRYPFNQWAFVTLAVWSGFTPDEPPTWYGAIQPILRQYANLYPVMDRFLDLGDYESVCAHAVPLGVVFGLGNDDPNAMPVTRDLSAAKRAAILRWLREPGPDGKPLKGTPPGVPAPPGFEAAVAVEAPAVPLVSPQKGGKASAASRRLVVQRSGTGVPVVDQSEVRS